MNAFANAPVATPPANPNDFRRPATRRNSPLLTGSLSWLPFLVLLFLPFTSRAQPVSEQVLHAFNPVAGDGASPYSPVIQGRDGLLYGTAWDGGSRAAGRVFRLKPDGSSFGSLHDFTNQPDGATPVAGVIQGTDGALYGTTFSGGLANDGTVFKIGTNGSGYAILWSFTNSPDGANPDGDLVQGAGGALYGTTQIGGSANVGTVFKIMPDGSGYTVLHSFTNAPDGATPFAGLWQAADGRLYGTTAGGGSSGGTIFTLDTNGGSYSVLYKFSFLPDGDSPEAALMQASNGFLYGTTVIGGTNGYGSVFRIATNGQYYARLYCFTNTPDGANPYHTRLIQAADGALYGTTAWGGNTNAGTVFKLNPDGTGYAVVHNFGRPGDGTHPYAGLAGNGAGAFYGTTLDGGTNGFGTIYQLVFVPSLQIAWSPPSAALTITGYPGESCHLQASTNLADWQVIGSLSLTNGSSQWFESQVLPRRFYRAVVP